MTQTRKNYQLSFSEMNPTEEWFHLLKNMRTFALNPKCVPERLRRVLEASRTNSLPPDERIKYFRAMISEEEKEDIAIAEVMRDIDLNAGMFVINVTQDTNTSRYLQRLYEAGKVIHTEEVIKEKNVLEDVLDILDTALRSLRKNFHVDAVSISVPGKSISAA